MTARMALAIIAATVLHLLALGFTLSPQIPGTSVQTSSSQRRSLEITMSDNALLSMQHRNEQHASTGVIKARNKTMPVIFTSVDNSTPEIISEIPSHIDVPTTPGLVLISLMVDETGAVESTQVIYSEVSRFVTRLIENRFATARFKPATRQHHAIRDEVLMKISIE